MLKHSVSKSKSPAMSTASKQEVKEPPIVNNKTHRTSTSYSTTTKNRTVSIDGQPGETTTESLESTSRSTQGQPNSFPRNNLPDDFEELKKCVLNGDAYKREQRINRESTVGYGAQHYKPQEGVTTIRPTRAERMSSSSSTHSETTTNFPTVREPRLSSSYARQDMSSNIQPPMRSQRLSSSGSSSSASSTSPGSRRMKVSPFDSNNNARGKVCLYLFLSSLSHSFHILKV